MFIEIKRSEYSDDIIALVDNINIGVVSDDTTIADMILKRFSNKYDAQNNIVGCSL